MCRLKEEQSPAPGSGAGSADRFRRKARAGEGGGLGGPGQSDSCLAAGRSSSRTCWLASELAELSDDNQMMDVASDQELAPLSKPVHAVFTIEQVRPHFDALMAEELPAQEDLCCNLRLNEHRRTSKRQCHRDGQLERRLCLRSVRRCDRRHRSRWRKHHSNRCRQRRHERDQPGGAVPRRWEQQR